MVNQSAAAERKAKRAAAAASAAAEEAEAPAGESPIILAARNRRSMAHDGKCKAREPLKVVHLACIPRAVGKQSCRSTCGLK